MKKVSIESAASSIRLGEDGIWYSLDTEAVSYPESGHLDSMAFQQESFWYKHRNRMIFVAMERWQPAGTVFDIGGGTGFISRYIQEQGIDTVLVEPGIDGAKIAKANGVESVVCGSTETAGFSPSTLPAIGAFDVIEHVANDVEFLSKLHTLLIPGGRFYATVPAYSWLWSDEDVHAGHFRRYSRNSFRQALHTAGFEIEFLSYFFWPLPAPIYLFRSLPSRRRKEVMHDAKKVARDHGREHGIATKALNSLIRPEVACIRKGKSIPFGSSLLVVAKKPE